MIKIDEIFTKSFAPIEQIVMLHLLLGANDDGIVEFISSHFYSSCGLTRQQFRTCLTKLSEKKEIEVINAHKSTIVCICNYDNYRIGKRKDKPQSKSVVIMQNKCEERKKEFERMLIPYVKSRGGIYEPIMIREFFDYWSELNKSHTKMRFELEKTWDLAGRLRTWSNRQMKYGHKNNSTKAENNFNEAAKAIRSLMDSDR